ncbi:MAG: polysaccharide biosynthesis tyrosine autokinase [Sulfitobacter sp.]
MKEFGLRIRDTDVSSDDRRSPALSDTTTLGDVLGALRRHYLPLVICIVLGLGLGVARHVTSPKQFYTSATVLVDDRMSELAEEITASIPFVRNDTSLLNEIQVLESLQLAIAVTETLQLDQNEVFLNPPTSLVRKALNTVKGMVRSFLPVSAASQNETGEDLTPEELRQLELQTVAAVLRRDINIIRNGQSFSITISYIGPDPKLSALIVNTYAEAYLADHLNANLESTERTSDWMRNRMTEIQKSSQEIQSEAARIRREAPNEIQALRDLALRAATLDALNQTISTRFEQVAIQGSFPVTNGRILTRAIVPKTAELPKLWQSVSIATLLGMMLGLAIVVFRETRERFFRVGEDIRNYTGHQFLGYLPEFDADRLPDEPAPETKAIILDTSSSDANQKMDTSTAAKEADRMRKERKQMKALAPNLFMSLLAPHSLFSETLRNVHTTLDLTPNETGCRVIGTTSMLPAEGKTTMAANYANMVAQSGARTLLVDMDLHLSTLSKQLRCADRRGIVEVLRGTCPLPEAIRTLSYSGLDFLPCMAGQAQSFPADVLFQKNMTALIAELRHQYDYVVLDLPPLGKVVDAKAMLARLDKIIFVCEWGKTPRNLVSHYLAHEPEVAQKILGVLLNKVDIDELPKYAKPGAPETYLDGEYGYA